MPDSDSDNHGMGAGPLQNSSNAWAVTREPRRGNETQLRPRHPPRNSVPGWLLLRLCFFRSCEKVPRSSRF
jgi:hypothetical protein